MEFIFNTKEEFKQHVKLWGNEPRNFKILETQEPQPEPDTTTQYYNIQEPTTPEEAQHPTPTREEQHKILNNYLNTAEIIPEEDYNRIQQILNPEPPEDTSPILEEDDEIISTHTIETTTEDKTEEEDPQEANQTDSEEEPPDEEETQQSDDEGEQIQENKTDLNIDLKPDKTEIYNAKDLLNSTYEANKFIEYLTFENAHKDEDTGQSLTSDISKINPTKYYTHKDQQLKEITAPFIDNIMLYKLIDEKQTIRRNGTILIHEKTCGFWNSKIRETAKKYNIGLPPHGVVCKKPVKLIKALKGNDKDLSRYRESVNKILTTTQRNNYKQQTNRADLNNAFIMPIKIELADENVYKIHDKLKGFLNELNEFENQIYLLDLDITRDYSGTFNKRELEEYLIANYNFKRQDETEYNGETLTIINNDKTVGTGCLTALDHTDPDNPARIKWYNKTLCQWTSPGVAKATGNHLTDYLYCPDKRLSETFKHPDAINRGITRFEITIYGGRLPTLNELINKLDEQYKYVNAPIFYYVPVRELWRNITEQITNNLIIYDKTEKVILIVYYVNLLTRKATSIKKQLNKEYTAKECERILKYCISNYSYKLLPCNVITTEKVSTDKNNNDIKLTLKTYRKLYGETQLSKSNTIWTSTKELTKKDDKLIIDIEGTGLSETPFIKFFIPKKTQNKESAIIYPDVEEYKYTEEDATNGIYPPKISTLSVNKRKQLQAKLELEEQQREYKEQHEEHNKKTLEHYHELKKHTTDIIEQRKQQEQKEAQIIRSAGGVAFSFTSLDINAKFTPIAFTFRKTKYNDKALIALRMEDNKLYYGGSYFDFIFNKYAHIWTQHRDNIYGLINFKPILTVEIIKYENNKNNNKVPKFKTLKAFDSRINIKDIKDELTQQLEQTNIELNNIVLQKLPPFKASSAKKLEHILEPNKEYTITHLDTAHHRGSKQHFVKLKEHPNEIIKANQFLNNAFNDNPQIFILKFKTLNAKYNSNRNKELDVEVKKKDNKNTFNILLSV